MLIVCVCGSDACARFDAVSINARQRSRNVLIRSFVYFQWKILLLLRVYRVNLTLQLVCIRMNGTSELECASQTAIIYPINNYIFGHENIVQSHGIVGRVRRTNKIHQNFYITIVFFSFLFPIALREYSDSMLSSMH